jgi:hypothetical protein
MPDRHMLLSFRLHPDSNPKKTEERVNLSKKKKA